MTDTKNAVVYLITNKINGKQYIGETFTFKKRMYRYRYDVNNTDGDKRPIILAIKKYGWDNFDIQIIKQIDCKNKIVMLIWENFFIKQYNTLSPNGYNLCAYGQNHTGIVHSEESKLKQSQSMKGKHSGKKNPFYGKKHTKAFVKKLIEINRHVDRSYCHKAVHQIDKDTNQIINTWESLHAAVKGLGGSKYQISNLSILCNNKGKSKTCMGYKWSFITTRPS